MAVAMNKLKKKAPRKGQHSQTRYIIIVIKLAL